MKTRNKINRIRNIDYTVLAVENFNNKVYLK